ncbi:MAG: hypothetical protein QW358_05120 [Candidatus Hadarchaeum sp.]
MPPGGGFGGGVTVGGVGLGVEDGEAGGVIVDVIEGEGLDVSEMGANGNGFWMMKK